MRTTILVVDDNQATRELMQTLLETQGFEVATADEGPTALEVFDRQRPDLVLLDVMLPGLDGFEICRRLKHDPETRLVPVVLVTGLSDSHSRVLGIEAGADDFLTKPVDRSELFARVRSLLSLKAHTDELERAENVLFALARSIEGKDPYTRGHCDRLAEYSARLGARLGLPAEQLVALRRAGVIHDIGKVAVPESILLKPGPLTSEEFEVMRQHVLVGERICEPLKSFRLVLPIIRHHHEKLDGSGYPDGLRGTEIPFTARVLQIVDVFDALTTERPYRRALSAEAALVIMQQEIEKGWWDPSIFAIFRNLVEEELCQTFPLLSEVPVEHSGSDPFHSQHTNFTLEV